MKESNSHEANFIDTLFNARQHLPFYPARATTAAFLHELFGFLFISRSITPATHEELQEQYQQLQNEIRSLLIQTLNDETVANNQTEIFLKKLPSIYQALRKDAEAIYAFDPAAKSSMEVLATYPGFYATAVYRIAHQLWIQQIPFLPRLLSEIAHSETGIDIHPGAHIGASFAIDHGTGIVIGETSVIGDHVKMYQGVTLGALSVAKEYALIKRHPTIEDNVVIYSGATILGGETIIGSNSIIGGNVWLTYSIPSNSIVYHKSEVHVKDNHPFPEPMNFVI
jgi:serine O-acetyltransferase